MNHIARPDIVALLGAAVATHTVQTLVAKGVLTEDESLEIYYRAIASFADDEERAWAVQELQALIPALRVTPKPA